MSRKRTSREDLSMMDVIAPPTPPAKRPHHNKSWAQKLQDADCLLSDVPPQDLNNAILRQAFHDPLASPIDVYENLRSIHENDDYFRHASCDVDWPETMSHVARLVPHTLPLFRRLFARDLIDRELMQDLKKLAESAQSDKNARQYLEEREPTSANSRIARDHLMMLDNVACFGRVAKYMPEWYDSVTRVFVLWLAHHLPCHPMLGYRHANHEDFPPFLTSREHTLARKAGGLTVLDFPREDRDRVMAAMNIVADRAPCGLALFKALNPDKIVL